MDARWVTVVLVVAVVFLPGCGGGGGAAPALGPSETLIEVSPEEGPTGGGTWTTLTGSGFLSEELGDFFVFFGAERAFDVTVIDDNTVLCRTPPGRIGPVAVNIIPEGTDEPLLAGGFIYVATFAYLADGPGAVLPSLRRVDLGTGDVRVIGPTGFDIRALAAASADILYAAEAALPFRLIRIQTGSGFGAAVALLRDVQTGTPVELLDLTWMDGRLLGRTSGGKLVEVDPATGLVTTLAPAGGPETGPSLASLGAGELLVGPGAGLGQLFSWSALSGYFPHGAPVPFLATGTVVSMTVKDSIVFGVQRPGGVASYVNILRIDPAAGSSQIVTALPGSVSSISGDF